MASIREARPAPASEGSHSLQPYRLQEVRLRLVRSRQRPFRTTNAQEVFLAFRHLANDVRESFWAAFLNASNEVICLERTSTGTIGSSPVNPAEVIRTALLVGGRAIILVHNHPSGSPEPSTDDRRATEAMVKAARLFDLTVLDHVIIGTSGRYYSFADEGILPK